METIFKRGCMKTAAIFMTVVMLSTIMKVPVVYAYFTAEARSDQLTFDIKAIPSVGAAASFIDLFLFEDEASRKETSFAFRESARLLEGLERNVLKNFAAGDSEIIAGRMSAPQVVQVEICLEEDGFDAADILISSVKLHYGDDATFALGGELNVDGAAGGAGTLIVDFDREAIAPWFEGADEAMEYVTFVVTGEGLRGGQDRFRFAGEAELLFKGSYGTRIVEINGPEGFFIPSPGEITREIFTLENQDGETLDEARWALRKAVAGVEIDADTGRLTIGPAAPEGIINILAMLQSEGRYIIAEKPVMLYAQPEMIITGAELITIPPPQKNVGEEYRVEAPADAPDFLLAEVNWGLQEANTGISVDGAGGPVGRVTVGGEATGGSFILLARLQVEMEGLTLPLTLQKEIMLEAIVVGAVEIFGETQITIPEGEAQSYVYEAAVYDPEGMLLAGEAAHWYLEGGGYGVSLDMETGVLTVDNSATAGSITVVAASERDAAISAYKTVNLEEPPPEVLPVPPAEQPVPLPAGDRERLQVEGSNFILIPVLGDEGTAAEGIYSYTARLFDEEGSLLEGAEIAWSLSGATGGIFLSDAGELIVTGEASAGTIWITATSVSWPEISVTYEVEISSDTTDSPPPAGEEPEDPEEQEEPEDPAGEDQPGVGDEDEEKGKEEEKATIEEGEENDENKDENGAVGTGGDGDEAGTESGGEGSTGDGTVDEGDIDKGDDNDEQAVIDDEDEHNNVAVIDDEDDSDGGDDNDGDNTGGSNTGGDDTAGDDGSDNGGSSEAGDGAGDSGDSTGDTGGDTDAGGNQQ